MLIRLLLAGCLSLGLVLVMGCQKGPRVERNPHGAPALNPTGGTARPFEIPADLIPPGAEPMKTDGGVSDRNYAVNMKPADVGAFFQQAISGANVESKRSGGHVTVRGGGWVIEIYAAGAEDAASATIVYATAKEVG